MNPARSSHPIPGPAITRCSAVSNLSLAGSRGRMLAAMLAAIPVFATSAKAGLSFYVEPNNPWPTGWYNAAVANMQTTVNEYNAYGDFGNGSIYVYYNSGIPTAQSGYGGYGGSIGDGGTYPNVRVLLHESSHWLGTGTYSAAWNGPHASALMQQFEGVGAVLNGDSQHYWPYGENYDNESSAINDARHVAMVYALREDFGIGSTAAPSAATAVTMTANDALGTSGFNYPWNWSDGHFPQAGTTYSTGNYQLRTPLDANTPTNPTPSYNFAGNAVTINNTNGINGGLLFKGIGTTSVLGFNNLILDGGYVRHASNAGDLFQIGGHVTLASTATIDAAQGNIKILAGISGTGSMTKISAYTLTLTGANTYSGQTFINGGTLAINGQGALGGPNYGGVTFNGGTLQYTANMAITNGSGDISQTSAGVAKPVTINAGGATIDTNGNNVAYAAGIGNGGTGGLTKTGAGVLSLAGANNYSGATIINGGTLRLAQQASTAVASYSFDNVSANTVVNAGTGGSAMNGSLANGAVIVAGGKTGNAVSLANGASVDINNPIADLGNTDSWTVSAWVKTTTAGASILTKNTTGSDWGYGNTVLYLGSGNGGGTGGIPSGVRYAGGFYQATPGSIPVNDGTWHQVTYVNSAGAYGIYVDGVARTLSAGNAGFSIGDIGSIVRLGVTTNPIAGDGTANFNGLLDSVAIYGSALSQSQITSLYQGSSTYGSLPSSTNVTIASGSTLDLNGAVQQIGSLTGAGGSAIALGSGQLTVNSASSTQFAGVISGPGGSLVKQGSGTLTLTAANTYTGPTTINAGVLKLDKVTSAAVANYTFDNISGSTVVNGGTGGATMNGALAGGATIVAGGQTGNAVSLANGASVNISSPITDLGNTANWTVSAWVKTTTAGSSILTKNTNGTNWATGNTIFYLGDGAGGGSGTIPSSVRNAGGFFQASTAGTSVADGTWHQVTYVNGGGSYTIYVDGIAQPLSAGNAGFVSADVGSIVRLGVSTNTVAGDGTLNYNGLLDNVQIYNQALSGDQVLALAQGLGVGSLSVSTDVTIASGATLDLNGLVQQVASLTGAPGSAVTLGTGSLIVSPGGNTTFKGVISGSGSVWMTGSGSQTLSGNDTYTGKTVVTNGKLNLGANQNTTGILVRNSAGITLNGGSLTVGSAISKNNRDLMAVSGSGLTIAGATNAWTATLDLGTNDMQIIGAGTGGLATVINQIKSGYAGGAWTGTGIRSSAASANPSHLTALGVIINGTTYGTASGSLGTFDTINPAATDVLVKYTYYGDANLDGKVDGSDYSKIDSGFLAQLSGPLAMWGNGDFNYDGAINGSDYTLIDNAYNTQGVSLAVQLASGNASVAAQIAAPSAGGSSVPEPITLAPMVLGVASLLGRRRRR